MGGRYDADRNAARNEKIFTKYLFGFTQVELAEEFELSQTQISTIIRTMKEKVELPTREDLVKRSVARLDKLYREAWTVVETEHIAVSHGRVVYGPDGEPLKDHAPVLQAIDRLLRIEERLAKLLGLDAIDRMLDDPNGPADAELQEMINEARAKSAASGVVFRSGKRQKL